ncbi:MAG: hypothetical protein JWP27_1953 [Flaviaesturariibacter sp.]|nr:hypothetical protein [Flaviaesturariibacter sp.]
MTIFDRLFRNQSPKHGSPGAGPITDLVLDWLAAADIPVALFESETLSPLLELSKADAYIAREYEEQPEGLMHRFFHGAAILLAASRHPDPLFFRKLFEVLNPEGNYPAGLHEVRAFVLESFAIPRFAPESAVRRPLLLGQDILKCYHAIHERRDQNISTLTTISHLLAEEKFRGAELPLLAYVRRQRFPEKAYVLVEALYCRQYDYAAHTILPAPATDADLADALAESVAEANETGPALPFETETLLDIANLLRFEYDPTWRRSDPKKRRFIRPDDLAAGAAFLEASKRDPQAYLAHLVFYTGHAHLFEKEPLFGQLLAALVNMVRPQAGWLKALLERSLPTSAAFLLEKAYTPLVSSIASTLRPDDPLLSTYEAKLFGEPWGYQTQAPLAAGVALLRGIAERMMDGPEKWFRLQRLGPCFTRADFDYAYRGSVLTIPGDKTASVQRAFVDDLARLLPVSWKGLSKKTSHFEDSDSVVEIVHDGKDISLFYGTLDQVNEMLRTANSGYRLVPIPVREKPYFHGQTRWLASLAFLSHQEFAYLNAFIAVTFPKLADIPFFTELTYVVTDATPFPLLRQNPDTTTAAIAGFAANEHWAWFRERYIDTLSNRAAWYPLMDVMLRAEPLKKPDRKWLDAVVQARAAFGTEHYYRELQAMLAGSLGESFWYDDRYKGVLKGFIWSCTFLEPTDASLNIVRLVIEKAYEKVPGVGPRSTATGNLGLQALVATGRQEAFGILNMMRDKTRYNRFATVLERQIDAFMEASSIPAQLLADQGLPRFGFTDGRVHIDAGDHHLRLHFDGDKLVKTWIAPGGSESKTPPSSLSAAHPAAVREANEEAKNIAAAFADLKKRVRTYWLYDRSWTGADWTAFIFNHPLLRVHLQATIWINETQGVDFMIRDSSLVMMNGSIHMPQAGDIIRFWHPVSNTTERIVAWQDDLWAKGLVQKERQAFREHYPFSATESAGTGTSRFAHHFLDVKKLMAVAPAAGWMFTYVHEGASWPRIYLKPLNITAHLECIYDRFDQAIPTRALYFTSGDTTKLSEKLDPARLLALHQVPAVTLSEICRDIDLFIATTSIARNPELAENRPEWHSYQMDYGRNLFSDNASAPIRKRILEKLAPQLMLRTPGFDGNFLLVDGTLHRYRINLGSGFAQVKSSGRHIPLLPSSGDVKRARKVSLPIEDDDTLYDIIAAALYLQNDAAIPKEVFDAALA